MQPEHVAPASRLTLAGARVATEAAFARAGDLGVAVVVVVVDPAGVVISMLRGDGAFTFSLEVAHKKAWTAAATGASTSALATDFVASPTLLHMLVPSVDELLPVGGGAPIIVDGAVIGAVGVSGATEAQDQKIADAAVTALLG